MKVVAYACASKLIVNNFFSKQGFKLLCVYNAPSIMWLYLNLVQKLQFKCTRGFRACINFAMWFKLLSNCAFK